mmetsp:Transcript_25294/g.28053  ORF Transcript_25294/g.28053 Transcript_25294/m.28053 type:complete len:101 (+) Transcript_25294:297-599(+)
MVLAVNKYDIIEKDEQRGEEIEETMKEEYLTKFAQEKGFKGMFRTSAKTSKNVTNTFSLLVREILQKKAEEELDDSRDVNIRSQSIYLRDNSGKKKKSKC